MTSMNPEELAHLAAVLERPRDDEPRLAYAAWLAAHGDPARARFIATQCELARLPIGDARSAALAKVAKELEEQHSAAWAAPVVALIGRWRYWFVRGFVERVRLYAHELTDVAEKLA